LWLPFIRDCVLKIIFAASGLKAVTWLLGCDKAVESILVAGWPITLLCMLAWCSWYYLAYYDAAGQARTEYHQQLRRLPKSGHTGA
jgi:hypothetical protein